MILQTFEIVNVILDLSRILLHLETRMQNFVPEMARNNQLSL